MSLRSSWQVLTAALQGNRIGNQSANPDCFQLSSSMVLAAAPAGKAIPSSQYAQPLCPRVGGCWPVANSPSCIGMSNANASPVFIAIVFDSTPMHLCALLISLPSLLLSSPYSVIFLRASSWLLFLHMLFIWYLFYVLSSSLSGFSSFHPSSRSFSVGSPCCPSETTDVMFLRSSRLALVRCCLHPLPLVNQLLHLWLSQTEWSWLKQTEIDWSWLKLTETDLIWLRIDRKIFEIAED